MFKADLHCHSCYSDGSDTPQELIDLALANGLSGLSITDHDTVDSYAEAVPYAQEKGLILMTGIEFSAIHKGDPVHVLGYHYSLESKAIHQLCERHQERRRDRNHLILEKLKKLGFSFSYEELAEVAKGEIVGRPHIAMLLMKRGVVQSVKEAFDRFLGEGKAAFDPGAPVSVEETIQVIHEGGGKAVIAHPHLIKKEKTIRYLLTLPFDGIEVYYASIPFDREERWLQVAQLKQWLITGGSDYHGSIKPQSFLGSSWVDEIAFKRLME